MNFVHHQIDQIAVHHFAAQPDRLAIVVQHPFHRDCIGDWSQLTRGAGELGFGPAAPVIHAFGRLGRSNISLHCCPFEHRPAALHLQQSHTQVGTIPTRIVTPWPWAPQTTLTAMSAPNQVFKPGPPATKTLHDTRFAAFERLQEVARAIRSA